ncbi:hypothetical protein BGX33_000920, partial [Mortierella sp. NVP41]
VQILSRDTFYANVGIPAEAGPQAFEEDGQDFLDALQILMDAGLMEQVLDREVAPADQASAAEDIVEVESESDPEDIILESGFARPRPPKRSRSLDSDDADEHRSRRARLADREPARFRTSPRRRMDTGPRSLHPSFWYRRRVKVHVGQVGRVEVVVV